MVENSNKLKLKAIYCVLVSVFVNVEVLWIFCHVSACVIHRQCRRHWNNPESGRLDEPRMALQSFEPVAYND